MELYYIRGEDDEGNIIYLHYDHGKNDYYHDCISTDLALFDFDDVGDFIRGYLNDNWHWYPVYSNKKAYLGIYKRF